MTWVATGTATLTAAEIAAATAAAEAAALAAAQAAAAQAATQAAAVTAAELAAPALTEVAAATLPEVAGSVLPEAGSILQAAPGAVPPPATPLPPAGLEQVASAGSTPLPPAGELVGPPTGLENVGGPSLESATLEPVELGPIKYQSPPILPEGTAPSAGIEQIGQGFTQAELNAINQGTADAIAAQGTGTQVAGPAMNITPSPTPTGSELISIPPGAAPEPFIQSSNLISEPPVSFESMTRPELAEMTRAEVGSNPFMEGLKSVGEYIEKNPFKSGAAAYMGLQYLGAFDQKGGEVPQPRKFNNPYRLSPNFRGGPYSEPNVYKPRYASGGIAQLQSGGPVERMSMMNTAMNPQGGLYPQGMIDKTQYATPTQRPVSAEMVEAAPAYERSNPMLMASGGIARYAEGEEVEERPRRYRGDLMGTLDKYNVMVEGRKSGSLPSGRADPYTGVVGTFEDSDVDTRLQNADVAAMTRLKKAAKRANVGIAAIPMGVQAGALNLPTNAAGGGIMQANLGSYAAGGNPRLLRGPGDGMSDNIPATIGGKQPARLADGEFVVPADVVSHLGNGSTDAGAKKLHAMMDKVRMDRTGKKKQAPAVKAKKYIPK